MTNVKGTQNERKSSFDLDRFFILCPFCNSQTRVQISEKSDLIKNCCNLQKWRLCLFPRPITTCAQLHSLFTATTILICIYQSLLVLSLLLDGECFLKWSIQNISWYKLSQMAKKLTKSPNFPPPKFSSKYLYLLQCSLLLLGSISTICI